jgi:hypothetical protein
MKKIVTFLLLGFALLAASTPVAFACEGGGCNIAEGSSSCSGC